MSLTVVLYSVAKVKPLVAQGKFEENQITDSFARCEQMLRAWVVKHSVIGGSSFGASQKGPNAELKVCT